MTWLERIRSGGPGDSDSAEGEPTASSVVERKSPGLAALFEGLRPDGRHAILDLGPAGSRRLRLLGRFARRIRFAGLVPPVERSGTLVTAAETLPAAPEQPYDVVLAWDVFDFLDDAGRRALVERLDDITAPNARIYAVVQASGAVTVRPHRIELLELDRVSEEPVGPPAPARPELLPAHVEKLLAPFEIVHAISLRAGLREYVARKGPAEEGGY